MSRPLTTRRARDLRRRQFAEQRTAARKAARALRRARTEAAERALRSPVASRPRPATITTELRRMLGLARLDRRVHLRAEEVWAAWAAVDAPSMDRLPWVLLLASAPWHRAPRTFRTTESTPERRRAALVRHLLGPWPAPRFLARALDVDCLAIARLPVEDQWAVGLLARVCSGRSLRDAVGSALPAGFTRAECRLFLEAPDRCSVVGAVRRATVLAAGGEAAFADRVSATALRRWLGPAEEAAWRPVLARACARPWLVAWSVLALARWVDWASAELRAGRDPLEGRTEASTLREVEAFHALRAAEPERVPASGIHGQRDERFVLRELRSPRELVAEGQRMGHCVGAYAPLVAAGKVAVFALSGAADATIEVVPALRRVVQVKARRNAAPPREVRRWVTAWARTRGLVCTFTD